MTFTGFPVAALDFYDDLELDNTKSFWNEHKQTYLDAVRTPMVALTDALSAEFGDAKIFRPHRDVRFSKDKAPYKTHQGAFVDVGPATGWYVEISARGVRTGAGFYEATGPRLAVIRAAIDDKRTGPALQRLIAKSGFELGGETLKTSPRGYDATHPRIDLLNHKQILLSHDVGFDEVIHTPDLLGLVRADWQAMRPLVNWLVSQK